MAEFIKQLPVWLEPGIEPPESKKETGWIEGDRPPAQWHNWQLHKTYEALKELQEKAMHKDDVVEHTRIELSAVAPSDPNEKTWWYEDLGESYDLGGGGGLVIANASLDGSERVWFDSIT